MFQGNIANRQGNKAKQREIAEIAKYIREMGMQKVANSQLTNPRKVIAATKRLKSKKAPRPDEILNLILKKLTRKACTN